MDSNLLPLPGGADGRAGFMGLLGALETVAGAGSSAGLGASETVAGAASSAGLGASETVAGAGSGKNRLTVD